MIDDTRNLTLWVGDGSGSAGRRRGPHASAGFGGEDRHQIFTTESSPLGRIGHRGPLALPRYSIGDQGRGSSMVTSPERAYGSLSTKARAAVSS